MPENPIKSQTKGQNQDKRFILRPHWRYYLLWYLLALATLPIIGSGILIFYNTNKKRKSFKYIIADDSITAIDSKYEHHVDLTDINRIELQQTWFQKFLGVGTLQLITSASNVELIGIRHPEKYKEILEKAIFNQTNRKKKTGHTTTK